MSRAVPALSLALLLALGAVSVPSPVVAASPTALKRSTLQYDSADFEVVEDEDRGMGGSVTLMPVDGLAILGLQEYLGVPADRTAERVLDLFVDKEQPAKPPYALESGPAGWTCRHSVADLKAPGVDTVLRCAVKDGDDIFMLSVITNDDLTPSPLLAKLRTLIATVRIATPAP